MSLSDGVRGPRAAGDLAQPHTWEQTEMWTHNRRPSRWIGALLTLALLPIAVGAADEPKKDKGQAKGASAAAKVSYDKQIRPILQAHCQGCHQPAKAGGDYVMTAFDRHAQGGRERRGGDRARQARREPS